RIGLLLVSPEKAWRAFEELSAATQVGELSYFELLTLLSGWIFAREDLRVRIYEAGLGGRLDATRIFRTRNVILTSIGLDHVETLGRDHESILREKIGILSERAQRLICMRQKHVSDDLIRAEASHVAPQASVIFFSESLKNRTNYLEFNRDF